MSEISLAQIDAASLSRVVAAAPSLGLELGARSKGAVLPPRLVVERDEMMGLLRSWKAERDVVLSENQDALSAIERVSFSDSMTFVEFLLRTVQIDPVDPALCRGVPAAIAHATRFGTLDRESVVQLVDTFESLPARLAHHQNGIHQAHPILRESAKQVAARTLACIESVASVVHHGVPDCDERQMAELTRAIDDVKKSVRDHRRWIDDVAETENAYPLPESDFQELLRMRGIEHEQAELAEVARDIIEEMHFEIRRIVRSSFRKKSIAEAVARARSQRPFSVDEAAAWTEELVKQSQSFAREQHPAALPSEVSFSLLRPIVHPGDVVGTDPPVWRTENGFAIALGEENGPDPNDMNVPDLEAMVARRVFPGHAFHRAIASSTRHLPWRGLPPGLFGPSSEVWGEETDRGWEVWAEIRLRELGFRDSPSGRLVTALNVLATAMLAFVEVQMVSGAMHPTTARAFLARELGFSSTQTTYRIAELLRKPTTGVSRLVGLLGFERLRHDAKRKWRHHFSEDRFALLCLGVGRVPTSGITSLLNDAGAFRNGDETVELDVLDRPT